MLRNVIAAIRSRGWVRVVFEVLLVVQLLHLGEHLAQMIQLYALGWPPPIARGIVSNLDIEKVHFVWNLGVLATLVWLVGRGVRSPWFLATLTWAVLHTSEHGFLLTNALLNGVEGQPGILGAGGWLARHGWDVPGLTTWSRATVHFAWNTVEVALLALAYDTFARWRWRQRSDGRGAMVLIRRSLRGPAPVLLLAMLVLLVNPEPASEQSGPTRYVNHLDPTCGGHSPCYQTIQAAVNAVLPGETILIQAGTYAEQVSIQGKNNVASAAEADRIFVMADPAAPLGGVVITGGTSGCTNGQAIRLQQSKFITLRGLTITGAGGQAIALLGGNNQNQAIHIERNRIFGNGSAECNGGITVNRGNAGTLIVNNLIYNNGRNGITFLDADGGPHYLVQNTIHGNAWSGVNVARSHEVFLVNNAITGNGVAAGATGGRFGVTREASNPPQLAGIHLLNNLICGNRLGEIDGPALDGTDAGNLTPTGGEGPGVSASPGCESAANVYAHVVGLDGSAGTADDDFTLVSTSPAIDRGLDPRTLGLDPHFNALFEADFVAESVRPRLGTTTGTAHFDIGALEFTIPDTQAPTVTILQPAASAVVRQSVTVQAQATDSGSGVASLALTTDGQPLTATVSPTPPASSVTATATWNTTAVGDGAHTLSGIAADRAGNQATATRVVTVDNTPPDTQITIGPSGQIADTSATFTFTGTDNLTPTGSLVFAWRLDGAVFSAFSSSTSASLTALTEGSHTFEVKARDLAGNEDPTPATRTFTVSLGPTITSVDPPNGPVGTLVTITGQRFTPAPAQVAFNGVAAVVRTATATSITTTVPIGAATGPLTVAAGTATASRAFTVTPTSDFTLIVAPAAATTIAGGAVSFAVTVNTATAFTGLAQLGVTGAPADASVTLTPPALSAGQTGTLTIQTTGATATGVRSLTVTGSATIDGVAVGRSQPVAVEVLAAGETALAGRVLDIDALPIRGVTLTLTGKSTLTDAGGNFLLRNLTAGANQFLMLDGSTAVPDRRYPTFPALVTLEADKVNALTFTPFLHPQKTTNFTPIVAGQETVVRDPDLPGFEMRIPADVSIIGWDGQPNTKVSVRTVPLDRMPLPHPDPPIAATSVYMFYFDKIGGGTPSRPVPVTAINDLGLAPGEKAELWYYDEGPTPGSATQRWQKAGTATVSADGSTITTDPGVGLPRFCCGAFCFANASVTQANSLAREGEREGDPVDLSTGVFVLEKTDLVLPGRLPITLKRTYRSGTQSTLGLFGGGTSAFFTQAVLQPTPQSLVYIEPGNTRTTFSRQPDGSFTNTTVPSLRGAVFTVNPDGGLRLRLRGGGTRTFQPPISGIFLLQSIVDRTGNTLTIVRNAASAPTALIDAVGRRLELTFGGFAGVQVQTARDPLGREVRYGYDGGSFLTSVTDPAGGVTRYAYDGNGNMTTITDARGITFLTNQYGASGRVLRQVQADGGEWRFAYMVSGARVAGPGCPGPRCPEVDSLTTQQAGYTVTGGYVVVTMVTDPRGNTTTYRFNSFGQLTERIDALGRSTKYERAEGTNLVLSTTDALERVTRFTYDVNGNVATLTDPAGQVRRFTYDPVFSKVTSATDPLGQVTRFSYDGQGNLTTITNPMSHATTLTYNAFGQPLTVRDPLGNTTTFSYDTAGNLVSVIDPLGNTTRRTYDAVSRLLSVTDPRSRTTNYTYDPLNRLTQLTDALGSVTGFSYDGNGNLLTVTDARGSVTTHTYDAMDQLETRQDPVAASETFAYDGRGNLIRHTDRKGQVATFSYDAVSRRTGGSYADSSTMSWKYDVAGRLVQATDSLGATVLRQYDTLDRLTNETTGLGTIGYQYDGLGRRTTATAPGQPPVTYVYDAASRVTAITRASQLVQLEYDAAGRRTKLTLPNQVSTEYQYDPASRLRALIYRNTGGVLGDLTYLYDPAGNRSRVGGSFARTLLPDPIDSATYNAANRQTVFGNHTAAYDANGSVTSWVDPTGLTVLGWDARNRLRSVTAPATTVAFAYDVLSRRTARTVDGVTTRYLYDGIDVVEDSENMAVNTYLRTLLIDEPLARSGGEFYLHDALGSVIGVTSGSGSLTTSYSYDPFGTTTVTGALTSSSFGYTGREIDRAGLYFYRARYYDPRLQRFISEDPIGLAGGLNRYRYAGNNPVRLRDQLGLCQIDVRFSPVALGAYHSYIVTTDPSGSQNYYRGGPTNSTSGGVSEGSVNSSSGSLSGRKDGSGSADDSPWGAIDTMFGAYDLRSPDWDPGTPPSMQVLNNGEPCAPYDRSFVQTMQDIRAASVPYWPLSTNSNATTSNALTGAGFQPGRPPVWAPGWGTPLP